jgi:hypothetical protein
MGQRAIPSRISRHSYHPGEQTVKNKNLDYRVERDVCASFDPDDERDAPLTEQVKQGHISETPISRDHDAALPRNNPLR